MRKGSRSAGAANVVQRAALVAAAVVIASSGGSRADVTIGQDWTPVANENGFTYFDGFTDYADGAPTTLLSQVSRNGSSWLKYVNQNGQYWGQVTGQGWANPSVMPPNVNANPRLEFDLDLSETTWGRLLINVDYGTGGGPSGTQNGSVQYDLTGLTSRNIDTISAPGNPFIEHISIDMTAVTLPRDADATFADLSVYLQPNFWGYWDPSANGGAGGFVNGTYSGQTYYVDNMRLTPDALKINGSWNADADGTWNGGPWMSGLPGNHGAVPNGAGNTANFLGVTDYDSGRNNIGAHTITVDAPVTIGVMNFNNANGYTISGANGITVQGAVGVPAAIQTNLGNHVIAAPVTLATDTTVNVMQAANTLTISNLQTSAGALTKAGPGTLIVNNVRAATLNVNAGKVQTQANGTSTGTSRVAGLSVAAGAKVDLNDNAMVVDYTGGSPLASIQSLLASGYAGGAWTGNGINSTAAAAQASSPHVTAIGVAEASALGVGSFRGQTITGPAVLLRYTYSGDADLSGTVDTVDFNLLAASFGQGSRSWFNGDFDYTGTVDTIDFNLLASNFSLGLPAPSLGALVPEPATAGAVGLAMLIGLTSQRRPRRRHDR